ncbi:MAG: hypothetical protein ACE5PO_07245, partial [Candidatus Bathyarchaeia archaeon]
GKPGNEFILHGYTWRILQVDEEKAIVDVESADPSMAAIPGWEGEIIPVPFEVAQEVALLRRRVAEKIAENRHPHEALAAYALDDASKARVVSTLRKHVEDGFPVPDERLILIEGFENYIVIHCCAGDKVNQTLSRVLASLITAKTGADVALQSDQYRIALITPYPLDSEFVKQELRQLHPDDVSKVLNASIDQTNLFMWRLWHNAKRFGVVSKTAEYRLQHAKMLLSALRATPVYDETTREICLENFDVEHASQIVQRINSGDLHVVAHERMGGFSPLAMPLLDKIAPHDLIQPARERSEVVSLFKERVMNKTLRFLCVFKGDWTGTQTVKHLKDPIRCPKCDSTLIAATYRDDADAQKLVRKKLAGRQLTTEEEKKWFELWRAASLLQNYGSKAAVALASRGVGPSTAVRILHREYRGEDAFYLALLKAERDYLRTRMFWD